MLQLRDADLKKKDAEIQKHLAEIKRLQELLEKNSIVHKLEVPSQKSD